MEPVPFNDKQHAENIRNLIMKLHSAVTKAQDDGLKIELTLNDLGKPIWKGYLDAVRIIRVL